MANPTTLTPEKKEQFLSKLREMPNVSRACRLLKISRQNAYDHREADPEFADAWDKALGEGVESLEEVAWKRAKRSSDTLLIFLLKAHNPDKYRETVKTEHSGKLGLDIDDTKARDARDKLDSALARLAERQRQGDSPEGRDQ